MRLALKKAGHFISFLFLLSSSLLDQQIKTRIYFADPGHSLVMQLNQLLLLSLQAKEFDLPMDGVSLGGQHDEQV